MLNQLKNIKLHCTVMTVFRGKHFSMSFLKIIHDTRGISDRNFRIRVIWSKFQIVLTNFTISLISQIVFQENEEKRSILQHRFERKIFNFLKKSSISKFPVKNSPNWKIFRKIDGKRQILQNKFQTNSLKTQKPKSSVKSPPHSNK